MGGDDFAPEAHFSQQGGIFLSFSSQIDLVLSESNVGPLHMDLMIFQHWGTRESSC